MDTNTNWIKNLNEIDKCKQDIKTALERKGVEMEDVVFAEYSKKIDALQLESGDSDTPSEPSTPTPSADYIYSNGYVEGGNPTDIATYVPYKIKDFKVDEDGLPFIELVSPTELMGWNGETPDFVFGVDVPTNYKLVSLEIFDPSSESYSPHGFKDNIRYLNSTVIRDGVTYNSHLRNTDGYYESSDVHMDPTAIYKYKITIKEL
jgi:hypothetical protein